ncbi:hypothetical protein NQ315_010666 [Exocentrus adspersus]|uniref:Uncharacterized protein n=1 Tax=Exocentrus adspersus TaxID=1586481 RepID=A0AAV8W6U7_9CUCU|nr:hypothetical protein NQ315_010666 [Exocentrus adspersus]
MKLYAVASVIIILKIETKRPLILRVALSLDMVFKGKSTDGKAKTDLEIKDAENIEVVDFRHQIHATDEGKNQKPKGKAFYIGLAFVELGSQKKEVLIILLANSNSLGREPRSVNNRNFRNQCVTDVYGTANRNQGEKRNMPLISAIVVKMLMILLSVCVSVILVMSLIFCLCWRKKTPKSEWQGLDGMVTQKNPDENVNHLPSAASCVDGIHASGDSIDTNKRYCLTAYNS